MPARKSARSKALNGTARRDRLPKPDHAVKLTKAPPAPAWLSADAKVQWRRIAPVAVSVGTVSTADIPGLALLAETLATAAAAQRTLVAEGETIRTADGGQKGHPAARTLATARSQAKALFEQFGLLPRARQSLDVPAIPAWAVQQHDAAAEDFLGGRRTPPLAEFLAADPSGPGGPAAWDAFQKKYPH